MTLDRRAALVIAHPGHELRLYNWINRVRPQVFVLTDGSGSFHTSRLHRTTSILNSLGARPGSIYGRLTDLEIYSAILGGNLDLFVSLAGELSAALVDDQIEYVVGDAFEGYNPAHDICRLVIDAAVKKACQMGSCLDNFDVPMAYRFADRPSATMADTIWIDADEQMQSRKLDAARNYSELEVDVNRIIAQEGIDSLSTEYLRRLSEGSSRFPPDERPYYEVYGEKQVAAGRYQKVIRYRDHVLPIAEGLLQFAESKGLALVANSDY
jgi:hypothetical protein